MRYKLNGEGYVESVAFGCYLNNCTEYTGKIPSGYNSLEEWASYARINAYLINSDGDLVLDISRYYELAEKEEQDAINNQPLIRKDILASEAILENFYLKAKSTGEIVFTEDARTTPPKLMITGIKPYEYTKFFLFAQGKNMLPCTAEDQTISGVKFTVSDAGAITAKGTATEDIEYQVSGNDITAFVLKKEQEYHLNLGGFDCELQYYDGEAYQQQYVGKSGKLKFYTTTEITNVILKIPSGATVDTTFFPQLEYGEAYTTYEPFKSKMMSIDFSKIKLAERLYPNDKIRPSADLFITETIIDYILIEKGKVIISVDGIEEELRSGNVLLHSGYNNIYASKDVVLDLEYSTNEYEVHNQASTTSALSIVGEDQLDDTGNCYVLLGGSLAQATGTTYQVFLQPYGDGNCHVTERTKTQFTVQGTENMKFGWEVRM